MDDGPPGVQRTTRQALGSARPSANSVQSTGSARVPPLTTRTLEHGTPSPFNPQPTRGSSHPSATPRGVPPLPVPSPASQGSGPDRMLSATPRDSPSARNPTGNSPQASNPLRQSSMTQPNVAHRLATDAAAAALFELSRPDSQSSPHTPDGAIMQVFDPSSSKRGLQPSQRATSSPRPAPPRAPSQQQQRQQQQQQPKQASPSPPTQSRLNRDQRNLSSHSLPRVPGGSSSSLREFEAALQQQGSSSALKDLETIWQQQHDPSNSSFSRRPRGVSTGMVRDASSNSLQDSDPAQPRGASPKPRGESSRGGALDKKPNLSRSSPLAAGEQQQQQSNSRRLARPTPRFQPTPSFGQLKEHFGGHRGVVLDSRGDDSPVDEWGGDSD